MKVELIHGDCLERLKDLEDNSIDSIVTDPPYELGFMGKSWDNTGIANNVELWRECLRVLKPGGHLLAFSGTRTYHRMTGAIEDAGFEVRDMIEWVYGSGFPKSLNIGMAVDKLRGNEREVIGQKITGGIKRPSKALKSSSEYDETRTNNYTSGQTIITDTKGTSEWEGWGTALKPAHEPICMARKPLGEKTVAENCLKWGTGGINIDESRVEAYDGNTTARKRAEVKDTSAPFGKGYEMGGNGSELGRFPANLIHDNSEEVRECFPETKSGGGVKLTGKGSNNNIKFQNNTIIGNSWETDSGNASRFFKSIIYQAKASKSERNAGCEELEEKLFSMSGGEMNAIKNGKEEYGHSGQVGLDKVSKRTNNHPTVKPIALMEYLIKMVTPKGGTVLDPFMGSGSTGCACVKNGYNFVGIDMTDEYIEISKNRIAYYQNENN